MKDLISWLKENGIALMGALTTLLSLVILPILFSYRKDDERVVSIKEKQLKEIYAPLRIALIRQDKEYVILKMKSLLKTHFIYLSDSLVWDIIKLENKDKDKDKDEDNETYKKACNEIRHHYNSLRKQLNYENNSLRWYQPQTLPECMILSFAISYFSGMIFLLTDTLAKHLGGHNVLTFSIDFIAVIFTFSTLAFGIVLLIMICVSKFKKRKTK